MSGLLGFLYLHQESSIARCTIVHNHNKYCNVDDSDDEVHDDHLHQEREREDDDDWRKMLEHPSGDHFDGHHEHWWIQL